MPNATKTTGAKFTDEIVSLATQDGRDIPVRVLTPEGCSVCPLIIFSHGANSTFDRYDALFLHIAKAGYRIAAPNHTDSEAHPDRGSYKRSDWLSTRLEDYDAVAARYETNYRVAAGHSFGALIAQIAGGTETPSNVKINPMYFPKAILAYSPPGPIPNYIGPEGWLQIKVPSLVTTGTDDIVPKIAEQWELHLVSYESAPADLSYALIYEGMDHYMNGAYVRETEPTSEARNKAMKHIVDASLFFLSNLKEKGALTARQWEAQQREFVEARTRK